MGRDSRPFLLGGRAAGFERCVREGSGAVSCLVQSAGQLCRWRVHQLRRSRRKVDGASRDLGSWVLSRGKLTFGESGAQQRGRATCIVSGTGDIFCVH